MKLAAAALSLALIVPGLAQSQTLAPPRLLYPGESPPSVPPPNPTPGAYPSATEPLGHKHPECLALYGKTPAQIEATPCGVTENIAANSTVSACTHNKVIDFQGDNITIDCVKWNAGIAFFGTRCDNTAGCKNLIIRRSTITGNNGTGGPQNMLLFNAVNNPMKSALVEKNDISRSDVPIYVHSSINGTTLPFPGEGDKALIIRGNRIHGQTQYPGAHTDLLFIAGQARGVLVENNLFDGSDAINGANVGSLIQVQQGGVNVGGNHVFRNNRFVHDGSDYMFNFDREALMTDAACSHPITFDSNVFDYTYNGNDSVFNVSSTGKVCTPIITRPGSTCTNNKFADGSAANCTSNGL